MNSAATSIKYYHHDKNGQELIKTLNIKDNDKVYRKKIKLLYNFQKCIEGTTDKTHDFDDEIDDTVHIEKWLRTKNAFVFKFTDKVFQVKFNDDSEIRLMKKPKKIVWYKDTSNTLEKFAVVMKKYEIKNGEAQI